MNKTEKRQSDLRNKLVAAVAMLLVSCIMMVSTTYAWFTLSTAPEIQGITTTVGANGNLEIALSPYSGNAADITSAMGDANLTWAEKNTTWGNLINLSDNSVYGLEDIALLPSRLNANAGANSTVVVNDAAPLSTPTYGADGRPQALNPNTQFGSKFEVKDDNSIGTATDFLVNDYKGIRVIGTSANMSEFEVTFNSALSDLAAAISSAKTNAQNSLNNNGGALTGMAIQHGLASGEDTNNYKDHVEGLNNVLTDLDKANAALADAIKAALLADAASATSSQAKYEAAVAAITDSATLAEIQASDYYKTYASGVNTNIIATVTAYASNTAALAQAKTNIAPLMEDSKTNVNWTEISAVLTPLMDTSKIKINGILMGEFTSHDTTWIGNNILQNGLNITMVTGSGLYADFGAVVGNIEATVAVPKFNYSGTEMGGWNAYMKTDSEVVSGGYMPAARTAIALAGVLVGDNAVANAVINVPYAYAVDFMFRTNAANSKLMLQTSPAQRVYEESVSSATQGSGSTMTFAVDKNVLSAASTLNLMKSLRVVFMDTATGTIYGIAKIDTAAYDAMSAGVIAGLTEIEGDLYLHSYTLETDGTITLGSRIAEDQANLCDLPQNTAKAITALVYLDGDNVTNADVANGVTSMMGAMNLQFSSSADLVPMENTALKEMEGEGEYKASVTVNGIEAKKTTVTAGAPFTYTVPASMLEGYTVENVVVTMGGEPVSNAWNEDTLTISISEVTGAISVTVNVTKNP